MFLNGCKLYFFQSDGAVHVYNAVLTHFFHEICAIFRDFNKIHDT